MFLRPGNVLLLLIMMASAGCGAGGASTPSPSAQPNPKASATTPVTPTATSTASPVPPTPTAPLRFTEEFRTKPTYWVFVEAANGAPAAGTSVQDGFLVFDLASANEWAYALYGGRNYIDVRIEAEVQSRTTGDGAAGLVCRYDARAGWYEFNVFADQTYQLLFGQWLAPGVARYTPMTQGTSTNIHGDTNRLGLECVGNMLSPSINGAPVKKWPELKFGLKHGQAGLSASSFADAPFMLAFDWVAVDQP